MRSALRHGQRLRVGVGDDEVDALQPGRDHVVDGVAAGAADTEHGDPRLQLADVRSFEIDCHGCLFHTRAWMTSPHGPVRRRPSRRSCMCGSSEALPQPSSDPARYSRLFLSSAAAFAAVRNVRDAPPADRPEAPRRPRRPAPWPLPADPDMPSGRPIRTCRPRMRAASSGKPVSWLAPPVSTTVPRGSAANGDAASRSRTISRISSTRGRMMRTSVSAGDDLRRLALVRRRPPAPRSCRARRIHRPAQCHRTS